MAEPRGDIARGAARALGANRQGKTGFRVRLRGGFQPPASARRVAAPLCALVQSGARPLGSLVCVCLCQLSGGGGWVWVWVWVETLSVNPFESAVCHAVTVLALDESRRCPVGQVLAQEHFGACSRAVGGLVPSLPSDGTVPGLFEGFAGQLICSFPFLNWKLMEHL